MLSQAKIDLAVLWKLFQIMENGSGAVSPDYVGQQFRVIIPITRIELALEQLRARGEVDKQYEADENHWKISRNGLLTVEKAIKLPNSFLGRLNSKGDNWLLSDDAMHANLGKNARYAEGPQPTTIDQPDKSTSDRDHRLEVHFNPTITNNLTGSQADLPDRSAVKAAWFGSWGTWVAAIVAMLALIATIYEGAKR